MREMSDKISRPVIGKNASGHIVERYLDVARALGCRVEEVKFPLVTTEKDLALTQQIMQRAGMNPDNPYVVLVPGANWPNKRWPAKYFAALVDWLYTQNIVPVVSGGGVVDLQLAAELEQKAEIPPVNLVGKTSLPQLAALLRQARLVVGGDTGPVHMAAGLKVPTVMLMGPTDANRNGPYGQPENAIEASWPCRYCWKRACPKGLDCLSRITPEQVIAKVQEVLQR